MYNFISLHLNCPSCNTSLMDNNKPVDNEPGIKLVIDHKGEKGFIWLSSVYGSYNYISDVEITKGYVAGFSCPNCNTQLTSKLLCKVCEAPMIDFTLDMGGRVSICTRSGCKNHAVEFEDLGLALKKLYQEYSYQGAGLSRQSGSSRSQKPLAVISDNSEIIETGSKLNGYCPNCHKSLIENDMLRLRIVNEEEGDLFLSPYLNVFTSKSTIFLPEDKVAKDLRCFHCNQSLIASDKTCEKCGSPAARISVSASTKLIAFYICTKKGCRWHGLKEEDLFDIRLEDSDEW